MHAFGLVLTYDLLEDRRIAELFILLHKRNRFHVAVRKNISDTLTRLSPPVPLFCSHNLLHFDVTCDPIGSFFKKKIKILKCVKQKRQIEMSSFQAPLQELGHNV